MPISLFEHLYGAPKQAPNKGTDYGGAKLSADIRSQPPTAQPLTIINEAAVGQAAYGGGGGGGLTSTISALFMPNNPAAGQGNINLVDGTGQVLAYLTQGAAYSYNASTVSTCVVVGGLSGSWGSVISGDIWVAGAGVPPGSEKAAQLTNDANGILYLNANGVSTANLQVSSINGAAPGTGGTIPPNLAVSSIQSLGSGQDLAIVGDNNAQYVFDAPGSVLDIQLRPTSGLVGCIGANGTVVWIGGQPGQEGNTPVSISSLYTTVAEVVGANISSLNVSSINGAAPGGGVGAAIGTSSITASTLSFAQVSSSGLVYSGGLVNNDVFINLTPLTGQYGNSGVIGAWGKEVYAGAPGWGEFAAQRYYVTDVQGSATNASFIQNTGNVINIQTPGSISLQAPTYISTLNVSSINGAVPGGGNYPKMSSIGLVSGGNFTNLSTNSAVVVTDPFDVVIGHEYQFNIRGGSSAPINSYSSFTNLQTTGGLLSGQAFLANVMPESQSIVFPAHALIASGQVTLEVTTNDSVPYNGAIIEVIQVDLGVVGTSL